MNRSSFLKQLFTSAIIGKLPVSITKNFRKIYLLQCFVAGFRHYEGMNLLTKMKEGDLLELVREPQNEYDECAIALHYQNKKIGFIPADTNEMLSYLLDADALSMIAVITHLEKNAQPWENVAVAIYFVQEVDKDLPVHASYLTRIEAPHYRTLNKKNNTNKENRKQNKVQKSVPIITFDDLFERTDRVINIDKIQTNTIEEKMEIEKYLQTYPRVMEEKGNYVLVNDDGIYNFMYKLREEIDVILDKAGKEFLEFYLD